MNRFSLLRIDLMLLLPSLLLVGVSLAALFSIDQSFFRQQLISLIVGIFAFFLFLNIDYRFFSMNSKLLYFLVVITFVIVLLFGTTVNGSKSWLTIGPVQIQPEEFMKPIFILVVAQFLAVSKMNQLMKYILSFVVITPIIFLIMRQPDTGTALMYIFSFAGMLIVYGFPFLYYFITSLLFLILAPIMFQFLRPYQKERLVTLFNITSDPSGSSYNAIQSLISIGSGGFFGKGLGEGTQSVLRFLPERQTDFIFATISEGLGFVGGFGVILLLFFILYRIYKISTNIGEDLNAYLITMGVFFLMLTQTVTNIGMNMGMLPIIGITLPLVSYGGSSLVTTFVLLGIVSSIAYENKRKRNIDILS